MSSAKARHAYESSTDLFNYQIRLSTAGDKAEKPGHDYLTGFRRTDSARGLQRQADTSVRVFIGAYLRPGRDASQRADTLCNQTSW